MSNEPVQLPPLTDDDALWMEYMRLEAAMHLAPDIEQVMHWDRLRTFFDALPVAKQMMLTERINKRYAHLPAVYMPAVDREEAEFVIASKRLVQLTRVLATTHPDSKEYEQAEEEMRAIAISTAEYRDMVMAKLPLWQYIAAQLVGFIAWCVMPVIRTLNRWML